MLGKEIKIGSLVAISLHCIYDSDTFVHIIVGQVSKFTPKKVRVKPLGQRPAPVTRKLGSGKTATREVISQNIWDKGYLRPAEELIVVENAAAPFAQHRDILGQSIDIGDHVAVPVHLNDMSANGVDFVICKITGYINFDFQSRTYNGPFSRTGMIKTMPIGRLPNRARDPRCSIKDLEFRWDLGFANWSYELLKISNEDVFVYALSSQNVL
jgi:hypothetical protein